MIIGVNDFNTVTNSGTLTAGPSSSGIFAGVNNTIVNAASGVITLGDDSVGIFTAGNSTVTNAGQITIGDAAGPAAGILAINDDNTVSNLAGATITVGINAAGISVQGNRAIVNNAGTINVGDFGPGIDVFGDDAMITSNGVINVGDNAAGISAQGDRALITHFGTINGGVGSAGVAYNGSSGTINNSGRILLGDDAFGIVVLGDSNTITNSGTITVGAGFAVGIDVSSFGGSNSIINTGTINVGAGATGILVSGTGTVFNSGTINAATGFAAIEFCGGCGTSVLTLGPGSVINGLVLGTGTDTFQLGGTGKDTFNLSLIGAGQQYDGFSTFNKVDSSNWTVTGTGAQDWNVLGGTLSVNGVINGLVTVNAGGTLGGTGTIDNVVVNGGVLAPGNSIGTLNVANSLTFSAASSYMVEISGTSSDLTTGHGRGDAWRRHRRGRSHRHGGEAVHDPDRDRRRARYIQPGGIRRFAKPEPDPQLRHQQRLSEFRAELRRRPQRQPAERRQHLDQFLQYHRRHSRRLRLALAGRPDAGLRRTGDRIAAGDLRRHEPVPLADLRSVRGGPQWRLRRQCRGDPVRRRERAWLCREEAPRRARCLCQIPDQGGCRAQRSVRSALERLGRRLGGGSNTSGNAALGSNDATARAFGFAVGADYRLSRDTLAGFALAGGGTNFSVSGFGSGRSDLFQAGAFIRHNIGNAYVTAAAAYGWQDVTTERTVTVAGFERLRAQFNANAFSGRIEGGYRYVTPWMGITPYAAGQFTTYSLPAYAEQVLAGAGTFALNYAAKDVTASRTELGVRTDKSFAVPNGILTLRGRAAWAHDFNTDRNVTALFQTLPGAAFVVNGAAQAHELGAGDGRGRDEMAERLVRRRHLRRPVLQRHQFLRRQGCCALCVVDTSVLR